MKKKRYIIKESQYKQLVSKKRNEKLTSTILEEVESINNSFKKESIRTDAIVETLKKHALWGNINEGVVKNLTSSGIDVSLIEKAGIGIIQD